MASIDWPLTLPQRFDADGYGEDWQNGVISSQMSTGPSKRRRRFTAVVKSWKGSMTMTESQYLAFQTFVETTTKFGTEKFNFPDPHDHLTLVESRFMSENDSPIFSAAPSGDSGLEWNVSFGIEVLP